MPLLNENSFKPNVPPPGLSDTEEVFFCRLTREIFRDYEQFCERIVLCNSLVWSCPFTGRSHLNYEEAAESENRIRRTLKKFPMELRIPVLYLVSICKSNSIEELAEDVFSFVKDRFFVGETVYVTPTGRPDKSDLTECHILDVHQFPREDILRYELKHRRTLGRFHWIHPKFYIYEVERMDNLHEIHVPSDQVMRKENAYTKERNLLFIKQCVTMEKGIWKLKESWDLKYGISNLKFRQMFYGEPPDMSIPQKIRSEEKRKALKKQKL